MGTSAVPQRIEENGKETTVIEFKGGELASGRAKED
jgi:hypothetical protein